MKSTAHLMLLHNYITFEIKIDRSTAEVASNNRENNNFALLANVSSSRFSSS
jgi:hypothetical protein